MRDFETYAALQAALALEAVKPGAFRFLERFGPARIRCSECGQWADLNTGGAGGTGYACTGERGTGEERAICYPCASKQHFADLERDGKGCLYLTDKGLSDWPGIKVLPIYSRKVGSHNLAGTRVDVWFRMNGREWHGVQYGRNTQICHVRRLKSAA